MFWPCLLGKRGRRGERAKDITMADRKFKRPFGVTPPAAPAPAAGPAAPWALACRPARRPRPPARPATRRRAVAHGLARHRCWTPKQSTLIFPFDAFVQC